MDEKDELENEQSIDSDADDAIAEDASRDDIIPGDDAQHDDSDSLIPEDDDFDAEDTPDLPITGDLDIDAALASVASLGDELAEREEAELAEQELLKAEQERADAERQTELEEARRKAEHYYPRPPLISLQRGQLASVLPALVLIALGVWWTFTLSTTENAPSTGTIFLIIAGCLGVLMLGYWLASGRWSSGTLFTGITLLTGTGVMVFLTQSDDIGRDGYALLLLAPASGMIITAIFASSPVRGLGFTGLLLLVSAIAGFVIANTTVDETMTDIATVVLLIVAVILVIIFLLPIISGRRGNGAPTHSD